MLLSFEEEKEIGITKRGNCKQKGREQAEIDTAKAI